PRPARTSACACARDSARPRSTRRTSTRFFKPRRDLRLFRPALGRRSKGAQRLVAGSVTTLLPPDPVWRWRRRFLGPLLLSEHRFRLCLHELEVRDLGSVHEEGRFSPDQTAGLVQEEVAALLIHLGDSDKVEIGGFGIAARVRTWSEGAADPPTGPEADPHPTVRVRREEVIPRQWYRVGLTKPPEAKIAGRGPTRYSPDGVRHRQIQQE